MQRKSCIVSLLAFFVMLLLPNYVFAEGNIDMEIIFPSVSQSQVAPDRDFYVIGNINGFVPNDAKLEVVVSKDAKVLRKIVSQKKDDKSSLNIDYQLLSYYAGTDRSPLLNSMMPDLVYDKSNPQSMNYPWIKAYFNDKHFTALVNNSQTYSTDVNYDQNGNLYQPLVNGEYQLHVYIKNSQNQVLGHASKVVKIGHFANRVLSRFSPTNHFERVLKEAGENNYQVLLDPFPGYWSPGSFISELSSSNIFAEILPKWRHADLAEYQNGIAHFYIYNVKESSATYNVEVGTLQQQQVIANNNRLICYYYKWGEPELSNSKSPIERFSSNDYLAITRVDKADTSTKENSLDVNKLNSVVHDEKLSDGVNLGEINKVAVSGVVRPIQNTPSDIQKLSNNSFVIKNKIKTLSYELSCNGQTRFENKEVGMERLINNKSNPSLLEFYSLLSIPSEWQNKEIKVTVRGYDVYGKYVEGTTESFYMNSNKQNIENVA